MNSDIDRGGSRRRGSRSATRLLAASLALGLMSLAGCGGSSDDTHPWGPATVSISLHPGQSISASVMETGTMPARTLSGMATGDLASLDGGTLFVTLEDPASLFTSCQVSASGSGAFTLSLSGAALPSPGHYTGTLKIHAALDAGLRRPLGGSPLLVPYDVTVDDALSLSTTTIVVEAPPGSTPAPTTVKATLTPFTTSWSARVNGVGACAVSGRTISPDATGHLTCAADGTITLTLPPRPPGRYTEALEVVSTVQWGGRTLRFSDTVAITALVTLDPAQDYLASPPQLQITWPAGNPAFVARPYALYPNAGVTLTRQGIEFLTHPAAADGHPQVAAWWVEEPVQGTAPCDVSGATPDCLPVGTYTARVHYLRTRDGVAADVYYPITLDIVDAGYVPTTLGSYQDYVRRVGTATSTTRLQVVASTPATLTMRGDQSSLPTSYTLTGCVLSGGGLYYDWTHACSVASGCAGSPTRYDPAAVLLPADLTPGHTETTVSTLTSGPYPTLTRAATVDGVETVTVPAGTFSALKVTTRLTSSLDDSYYVAWWARGVGRVKMVTYPVSTPSSTHTWELTGHGVAPIP